MLKKLSDNPLFLASVMNCTEAEIALRAGAQIIDCKDASQGPIGALPYNAVLDIVKTVRRRAPVSATIGNIIKDHEAIYEATYQMSTTGVDFVKVGLFKQGEPLRTIQKLANLIKNNIRIVGLLFAEEGPDLNLVLQMSKFGFSGVMLDTLNKNGDPLPELIQTVRLKDFVDQAHKAGLFVGLAGSLRLKHIEQMKSLKMDLLGFRGALCKKKKRENHLDEKAVQVIANQLESFKSSSNPSQMMR